MTREADRKKRIEAMKDLLQKAGEIEKTVFIGRVCEATGITIKTATEYLDVLIAAERVEEHDGLLIYQNGMLTCVKHTCNYSNALPECPECADDRAEAMLKTADTTSTGV